MALIALGAALFALLIHNGMNERIALALGGIIMTAGIGFVARTLAPKF